MKLTKLPQAARTMLAIYDDFDAAAESVSAIIAAGIIPAALEMLDDVFLLIFGFALWQLVKLARRKRRVKAVY